MKVGEERYKKNLWKKFALAYVECALDPYCKEDSDEYKNMLKLRDKLIEIGEVGDPSIKTKKEQKLYKVTSYLYLL